MFEPGFALKVKKVTSQHSSGINHEKEESAIPSSAVPVLLMVSLKNKQPECERIACLDELSYLAFSDSRGFHPQGTAAGLNAMP